MKLTLLIASHFACLVLGAYVGLTASPPPRIEVRRIVAPVTPANIIGCPVTPERLAEHYRTCKARKRNTIQPKGTP